MAGGVVLSVLGILAIVLPQVATLTIETLVGIVLILAGVGGFSAMRGNTESLSLGSAGFLFGLMLLAGTLMLVYPIRGAQTLTLLLTGLFLVEGAVMLVIGLRIRKQLGGSGWLVLNGAATLILAIMIGAGWPSTGDWIIGLLVGINLLTTGMTFIMFSTALRKL